MVETTATFDEYRFENDVNVWEAYNNYDGERWVVYEVEEEMNMFKNEKYVAKRVDDNATKYDQFAFDSSSVAKNFVLEELDS